METLVEYTEADWLAEDAALKKGSAPPPCPSCGRTGFYAPRADDNIPPRHYRACKFCGLWQDVGMRPHTIIRYECHHWLHQVADWKEPHESWDCPVCDKHFMPVDAVSWPRDNPAHLWWKVPQSLSQAQYAEVWTNLGMRPPPFGII